MGKPRGDVSVKSKQNVSSDNSRRRGIKRRSYILHKISFKNVKQAFDENPIPNLNKLTACECLNKDGTFPSLLSAALDNRDYELFDFLLERGADPNVVDPGRMPYISQVMYMLAVSENEKVKMIRSLINAGADIEKPVSPKHGNYFPLQIAVVGHPQVVKLLINEGANMYPPCLDQEDCTGCSLLSLAIALEEDDIVDFLLKKGIDVNINYCKGDLPALYHAIGNNDVELIKRLLDLGADINMVHQSGGTPLLYALKENISLEALRLLLSHVSIDVNIVDLRYKESAVHLVVHYVDEEDLDCLLNANPDMNVVNMENQTAVELEQLHMDLQIEEKVKKHIVKLRAARFFLIERNLSAVSGKEYDDFYAKCCQQVDLMKKITIATESHVNFHDLLLMSEQKLALCLESLEDQEILQSGFHAKFPLYAGMIENKLNKAIQWKKLREALNDAVYCLFHNHLPYHIMENIFSYFSIIELIKLRKRQEENPGNGDENFNISQKL